MPENPQLSAETVFLVGNGVMRVPSLITSGVTGVTAGTRAPSWAEYMERLWSEVAKRRSNDADLIPLADFARLSPPRQAEWFDQKYNSETRGESRSSGQDLAAFRLHVLGQSLHPRPGLLTNPIVQALSQLVVQTARLGSGRKGHIDIITTNLDCALEQNLALAMEVESAETPMFERAEIEVVVGFRRSVLWKRLDSPGEALVRVRLWKLHGCLRDIRARVPRGQQLRIASDPAGAVGAFCGSLPERNLLPKPFGDVWFGDASPRTGTADELDYCVFSQSEYFRNLSTLVRLSETQTSGGNPEQIGLFKQFRRIVEERPLIMVGYGLLDDDIDIVYALQTFRPEPAANRHWTLVETRGRDRTGDERLRQMGVLPWTFVVEPLGYCREPGRLREDASLEWRRAASDGSAEDIGSSWRKALQDVVARAWLEPQRAALVELLRRSKGDASDAPQREESSGRLVVAGLGSIWHGFSLHVDGDFPLKRRASARLTSVDEQVPGGSGLVPVMVAAAVAGPGAAGRLCFLSNVPANWRGWREIEEFCLAAAVDVRPWPRDERPGGSAVARTSHVIFFDEQGNYKPPHLPKQRFIMDVQSYVDPQDAFEARHVPSLPKVSIPEGFQATAREDFLFADKEASAERIRTWRGPTVFETGASGIELIPHGEQSVRPTMWTSGIGSMVRTIVEWERRSGQSRENQSSVREVIEEFQAYPVTRGLARAHPDATIATYLAKLVSFSNRAIFDSGGVRGFSHAEEHHYGLWLRGEWFKIADSIRCLLYDSNLLRPPHPVVGGGMLTTCHAGGLMAAWSYDDGHKEDIVVKIDLDSSEDIVKHMLACEVSWNGGPQRIEGVACVVVDRGTLYLSVGDGPFHLLCSSVEHRRNTLAAGDAVRGVMAYGLWALAFRPEGILIPQNVPTILFVGALLATIKCYAGSFVDFLRVLEDLRPRDIWKAIWQPQARPPRVA